MNSIRPLKGLSIAVIIVCGLSIFAGVAMAAFMAISSSLLANDPQFAAALEYELMMSDDYSAFGRGASIDSITSLAAGVFSGITVFSVFVALVAIVGLITGIVALRNLANPQKLRFVFGLGIAAAIINLLVGNLITAVLLAIMAIYANKAYREANYSAQAAAALQNYQAGVQPGYPNQYQQPMQQPLQQQQPTQPQQPQQPQQSVPYQQPGQPVQPQQPAVYQQPMQPQQPVQPQVSQVDQAQPVQQVPSGEPNNQVPQSPQAPVQNPTSASDAPQQSAPVQPCESASDATQASVPESAPEGESSQK